MTSKWLAVVLAGALSAPVMAGTVVVHIHKVTSSKGRVMVSLCTEPEFMKNCTRHTSTSAVRGAVTVTFKNVAPGRYASSSFHDENGDGTLNRADFGIPVESTGFSRNAKGSIGPPAFAAAALDVGKGKTTIDIDLIYY